MLKNSMFWKILSGLLFCVCIYMFYVQIDSAVTHDHREQDRAVFERSSDLAVRMLYLKLRGIDRKEFESFVRKNFSSQEILEVDPSEPNTVTFEDLIFKFENNKLKDIVITVD